MKRGCKTSNSSDILTGGSGDVNPQILQYLRNEAYTNTIGSQGFVASFSNPVWDMNRSIQLGCDKNKAFAMEVLSVDLISEPIPINAGLNAPIGQASFATLSNDASPAPAMPAGIGLVASWEWATDSVKNVVQPATPVLATQAQSVYVSGAAPTGAPYIAMNSWKHFDLTDSDGHGVLCGSAVFNLRYLLRFSAAPAAVGDFMMGCRILYRLKAISYQDWVRQFTFGV
jgi:hypothetical protein